MNQRVDFSANANDYDRRHGTVLPREVAQELADSAGLRPGACVLDVGTGTGRAAIAFGSIGYRTTGLDPAPQMLSQLRIKAAGSPVQLVAGEGARLPFATGYFDAVILARVLYLMPDWETVLQAVSDVLKPGGCVFHEWGNGHSDEAWVQIREKLRELFRDAGVDTAFHPGARSEAEVETVLNRLGLIQQKTLRIGPGPQMNLNDFVRRIAIGEFSYTWNVPKYVQESCMPLLQKWSEATFDLVESLPIPRELQWTIYRNQKR